MSDIKKKREISKNVIDKYISSSNSFTYAELKKDVISSGGHFNAVTGVSIGDYVQHLVDEGILIFNKEDHTYTSTVAITKKKKKR